MKTEAAMQPASPVATPVAPAPEADAITTKVAQVAEQKRLRADGPNMTFEQSGTNVTVTFSHPDPEVATALLLADLGSCDPAFFAGMTNQIASVGSPASLVDEVNSNFLLSVVRGVQPRDELEAMLALQMGAIHSATMRMAERLTHAKNLPQQDAAERAMNKLARTYATQMESLKRYRTGGQQKVIVEHVTVNEGGQAIVGAVLQGGRGAPK